MICSWLATTPSALVRLPVHQVYAPATDSFMWFPITVAKIIRHCPKLNADALLPRWIASLPVFVDAEEMTPAATLLLELMARGHASVAPNSPVAQHIIKALVSNLQSEVLPAGLETPLAQALKAYVGGIPGGVQALPGDVQGKIAALA